MIKRKITILVFIFLYLHNDYAIAKVPEEVIKKETSVIKENNDTSPNNNEKTEIQDEKQNESKSEKFTDSKIFGILLGSSISTTVSLVLYYITRRNAKNQLIFDIALKNLLPTVYMPILGELKFHKLKNRNINVQKIETVIIENGSLINFAPKNIRKSLEEIFNLCASVDSPKSYKQKENQIKVKLEELETEIMKRFGALIG